MCESVGGNAVAQNLEISDGIIALHAGVADVTLDGINTAIFNSGNNAHMVRTTILGPGFAVGGVPVEEDQHSGNRGCGAVGPLAALPEPIHAPDTAGKFGDDARVNIPTFVGTPGNKASAPFHSLAESIPTPIRLSTHIANLGGRYRNDLLVRRMDAIQNCRPHGCVFILKELP